MSISNQRIDTNQPGEPLAIRAATPRASLGLKKRAVIILVVILVSMVGLAIVNAFSPRDYSKAVKRDDKRPAFLGDAVRGLPNDYSALPRETPKPVLSEKNESRPPASASMADRLSEELRANRLKQAAAAHASDVTFYGVTLPKVASTEHEQSKDAGAPMDQSAGILSGQSPRDEDNRQDDKRAFIENLRPKSPYLTDLLHKPLSPFQIMAGSIIPGVLLTGVNSDLPGQLTGQVSENIFDSVSGDYLLIPQGTRVIGEYDSRISYGQERVLIVWTRLIYPNGNSLSLEGMPGIDLSGYAGLHERVNNHYLRLLTGVVFGSLLGASAQMAHGSNRSVDPTFGQLALEGTAQNVNQAGQQITRKNLNLQPTLEISPGQRFSVFVTKDLILEPYN